MNNSQVAHVWAQQTKSSGKGNHFFFEWTTIYSYGHHFPIATFVQPKVVLLTTRLHSVSTAGHVAKVRQAVRHDTTVFHVDNVNVAATDKTGHLRNFDLLRDTIKRQLTALAKCRTSSTKARTVESVLNRVTHANAYAKHFRLGRKVTLPPGHSFEELTALGQAWDAKEQAATTQRQKAQEKKGVAAVAGWLVGDNSQQVIVGKMADIYLRVRSSPLGLPIIQTSHGAEFPVADALRAYPVLQQIVAQGETVCVTDRAIRLGEFSVDFVRADGTLVVGCHRVRWSEVQRMAGLLGMKV